MVICVGNTDIMALVNEFHTYLQEERKLKENSINGYLNDVKKFVESFGHEVITFTEDEILSYLDTLKSRGKAPSGISRFTGSLRAFYRFLYEHEKISTDFSGKIKYNKTERKTPEILTSSEINRMFLAITDTGFKGARDRALLELMYATGLKVSEILSLKRTDINLKKNMVNCTVDGKSRKIPLYQEAADALREYTANYGQILKVSKLLFVNIKGGPITRQGLWKIISGYAKKAGIKKDISPSVMRNSFAAHLLQNGADVKSVQEMLGHSSMSATRMYQTLEKTRITRVYKNAHPKAT